MQLFALFVCLLIAVIACSPAERDSGHTRAQPHGEPTDRTPFRETAVRASVKLTPPQEATLLDGVYYVVLEEGFGKERPALGQQALLAITYISYDERGEMKSEPHFALQELDAAPPEWRNVLRDMVAGEKRRIWIPEGDKFQVNDLELQSVGKSPGTTDG